MQKWKGLRAASGPSGWKKVGTSWAAIPRTFGRLPLFRFIVAHTAIAPCTLHTVIAHCNCTHCTCTLHIANYTSHTAIAIAHCSLQLHTAIAPQQQQLNDLAKSCSCCTFQNQSSLLCRCSFAATNGHLDPHFAAAHPWPPPPCRCCQTPPPPPLSLQFCS